MSSYDRYLQNGRSAATGRSGLTLLSKCPKIVQLQALWILSFCRYATSFLDKNSVSQHWRLKRDIETRRDFIGENRHPRHDPHEANWLPPTGI